MKLRRLKMNLPRIAIVSVGLFILGCGNDHSSDLSPGTKPEEIGTDWPQWGGTPSKNMMSLEKNRLYLVLATSLHHVTR
jgi:hypothetical protein